MFGKILFLSVSTSKLNATSRKFTINNLILMLRSRGFTFFFFIRSDSFHASNIPKTLYHDLFFIYLFIYWIIFKSEVDFIIILEGACNFSGATYLK